MQTKNYISKLCETIDFKTVLEIGSGYGALTNQLLEDHAITKYISCDPDMEAVEHIQKTLYGKHTQLKTFPCKFENFMLGDTKFDLVLTVHVLEQIEFNKKGSPFEILNKMCNSSNKYIIHTTIEKEQEKYIDYWKKDDWVINNIYCIDEIRRVFLVEKI